MVSSDNLASAEAIRSAESRLVKKTERTARLFGGAWEQVIRLAMLIQDGTISKLAFRMETTWRDPSTPAVAAKAGERQPRLIAALVTLVLAILAAFRYRRVTARDWDVLLGVFYPHVERYRQLSAQLGREFFDAQRAPHHPGRHDVLLAEYEPEWFAEALTSERHRVSWR